MQRKTTERDLQRKVIAYLKTLSDCWFYKVIDCSTQGLPDIIGCYLGSFFAIELKRPGGKLTKLQGITLRRILLCKGAVCLAEHIETVKAFMEGIHDRHLAR